MKTFGNRLREERNRLGLNQTDFAGLGMVKKGAQIKYESGERMPDALYLSAIAAAGADVNYILTGQRSLVICENSAGYKLSPEQKVLLDNYANCSQEDKEAIKRMTFRSAVADTDIQLSQPEKEIKKQINGQ
jgi:transcriptional regulator with XRE-family HTH domain